MNQQAEQQSNVALQRESALRFRADWPNTEAIRFPSEGKSPGIGASWRDYADVIVGGKRYQVIIGPHTGAMSVGGTGLPPLPPTPPPAVPLTITFSDGSSEIIE